MGLFFKKKKASSQQDAVQNTSRLPWRKGKASQRTPRTAEPATPNGLLGSLDIEPGNGDYEIMTPDTRKSIEHERAAIRKNLFTEDGLRHEIDSVAANGSAEVRSATSDGNMLHTIEHESDEEDEDDYDDDGDEDWGASETVRLASLADTPRATTRKTVSVSSVDESMPTRGYSVDASFESTPERPFDESATKRRSRMQDAHHDEEKDDLTLQEHTLGEDTRETMTYDSRTFVTGDSTANDDSHNGNAKVADVARKLFGALNCADEETIEKTVLQSEKVIRRLKENTKRFANVMDHFYDPAACTSDIIGSRKAAFKRPYYDEEFTRNFLKRMTTRGSPILVLAPPHTSLNPSEDWCGRTVTMFLEKGTASDDKSTIQPALEWTTMPGGQTFEVSTTSISLYRILSICKSAETPIAADDDSSDEENEKECFFTITTESGDTHFFEASSVTERDRLVNGLKNVLSRLAFHLIAGDATASSELYDDDSGKERDDPGDLPHLPNPHQIMNRLSHILLD